MKASNGQTSFNFLLLLSMFLLLLLLLLLLRAKMRKTYRRRARILTTMRFTFELKARISECGD